MIPIDRLREFLVALIVCLLSIPSFAMTTIVARIESDGTIVQTKVATTADSAERNTGKESTVTLVGRVLADYRNSKSGFVALEDQMGAIHRIPQWAVVSLVEDDTPFTPYTKKEVQEELKREFGGDFNIQATDHFTFVYNTSEGYVTWCGKLFESLYSSLEKFRSGKGLKLSNPDVPMVVVVLSNKEDFQEYVKRDAPGTENIIAYYHRMNNRIVLYDLSEEESKVSKEKRRSRTYKQVEEILSRPRAAFNIATIIHEATHQICFNRKMFSRCGPFPMWFAEGMAMHFESPDVNSSRGWTGGRPNAIKPNHYRLNLLKEYLAERPQDPIQKAISEEGYLSDPHRSYAISWALFYYLQEKQPKQLVGYIEKLGEKIPFAVYSPEERLTDFEEVFGSDWNVFYQNFGRFIQSIR